MIIAKPFQKLENKQYLLMQPNQFDEKVMKRLGFDFESNGKIQLPEHWLVKRGQRSHYKFIDGKGRYRGTLYCLKKGGNERNILYFAKRYEVISYTIGNYAHRKCIKTAIFDMATEKEIYEVGICPYNCEEVDKFRIKGLCYLQQHFPKWNDPVAYWD